MRRFQHDTSMVPSFSREIDGVGLFQLLPLRIPDHMPLIHEWVTQDYARYWGMQEASLELVTSFYQQLQDSKDMDAYLGFHDGAPAFLLECYKPDGAPVARHYRVEKGDHGMHFLVAPAETPIPNFTFSVMTVIMEFLFNDANCDRVVVEPDIRNSKIHKLNRRVGFAYERVIELPEKTAYLAFCTREQFNHALQTQYTQGEAHNECCN